MSEPTAQTQAARQAAARAARVWQPSEMLQPLASASEFSGSPWQNSATPYFSLTDFASGPPSPEGISAGHQSAGTTSPASSGQQAEPASAAPASSDPPNVDLVQALESARAQGRAEGEQKARAEMQEQMESRLQTQLANDHALVAAVQGALAALKQSPEVLYEPLKRLALHLAEQLVLAELSLDGKAIERLVQSCIDELSAQDESMVQVELHSSDLAAWNRLGERNSLLLRPGLRLLANDTLARGSVRARCNERLVEDLIHNRLAGLARILGVNEPRWRNQSGFNQERSSSDRPLPQSMAEAQTDRPARLVPEAAGESIPGADLD